MSNERSSIIISVFSTTPGIGKTVTAINIAAELAKDGYGVCLVDLDLQFGDVMNYLQLNADSYINIATAQQELQEDPDTFNVTDFLVNYNYDNINFSVLPPSNYIHDAYQIDVYAVESIINSLNYFEFVILDLNSVYNALNLAMLVISTIINFIGIIDFLPALKNFKIGYETLLRFEYEESKIRLIENRADSQKLIKEKDVERLIGEPFYHRLSNDFPAVTKSIKEGRPLMFAAPNSRLTADFSRLVGKYTNRKEAFALEAENDKKEGFFSKYLNSFFKFN